MSLEIRHVKYDINFPESTEWSQKNVPTIKIVINVHINAIEIFKIFVSPLYYVHAEKVRETFLS